MIISRNHQRAFAGYFKTHADSRGQSSGRQQQQQRQWQKITTTFGLLKQQSGDEIVVAPASCPNKKKTETKNRSQKAELVISFRVFHV